MFRRVAAAAALLLAGACRVAPVTDEVTIEFARDDDTVVVAAETSFDLEPPNRLAAARVEGARTAAQLGTDAWSARFARVAAERERITFHKSRGALERVTRSVRIPSRDLQGVFSDTNVTVQVVRGEEWSELRFYPGTSSRATREQREHFDRGLEVWSRAAARYFNAVDHLYRYIDSNPGRARYLFAAVMNEIGEDGVPPLVLEEEQPLVDEVVRTMDVLAAAMDAEEGRASTFAEEADLIYNPFPGRFVVKVPGDVLASEGFDKDLTVEPIDLFESIEAMEGRWISPDPLALLLRDEEPPTSEELAAMPRRSTLGVTGSDLEETVRAALERPKSYSVRWRD